MEHWGVREHVHVVELFIQSGFITETRCRFRCENEQEALSPNAIHEWGRHLCEEGSVMCQKPPGWLYSVCTPKKIAQVFASVGHSPS